jgi:hypothetical protein
MPTHIFASVPASPSPSPEPKPICIPTPVCISF